MFLRDDTNTQLRGDFTSSDLIDGQFHHLMVTVDLTQPESDRAKVFVDGTEISTAISENGSGGVLDDDGADAAQFSNFENTFAVGAVDNRGTLDKQIDADIDEFAIHTQPLSAQDAADHSAAVIPTPGALSVGLALLGGMTMIRRRRKA